MPDEDISALVWDKESLVRRVKQAVERRFVPSIAIAVCEDGTASPQAIELLRALRNAVRETLCRTCFGQAEQRSICKLPNTASPRPRGMGPPPSRLYSKR